MVYYIYRIIMNIQWIFRALSDLSVFLRVLCKKKRLSVAYFPCLILFLFSILPIAGFANGSTSQKTVIIEVAADAEIDQHINYSSKRLGSKTSLRVQTRDVRYKNPVVSPQSWGLMKWDLSRMSPNDTVYGVSLQIQQVDSAAGVVDVYSIDKGDWSEATVSWKSWNAKNPQITFLEKMKNIPIAGGVTSFHSAKLLKVVQDWISGKQKNYGLLLKWAGKVGQGDTYVSREHKGKYIKPRLVISYTPGKPVAQSETNQAESVIKGYTRQVAAVMDIDYDLICYMHTPEVLQKKMKLIADCGFKRIYIVAPPNGDPDYVVNAVPHQKGKFLVESREALGDPLKLAIKYSKEAGMEVFVQFKPYEGGGSYTVPEGFIPPFNRNWLKTIGGRAVGLDPFLIEHPEMRPKRKPTNNKMELPADKIEMVFVLDRITGRDGLSVTNGVMSIKKRPDLPALSGDIVVQFPAVDFNLYTSKNNGKYELYPKKINVSEKIERRLIRDANGRLMFPGAVKCRVIELTGFKTSDPYLAVKFNGEAKGFRTIPYSSTCFKAFSGETELPVTVTPKLRYSLLTGKSGFVQNGFEFNELAPYFWDSGWKTTTLYGIARGKAEYQRGTFSEAYPEVREHWLKQIKKFIELGCDGVDLRMMCHSAGISDFTNYSYNQPIVDEYKKRYGVDIAAEQADPIKLLKLRGDFFMKFVRDAVKELHRHNLKLQMHVADYMEHPTLDAAFPSAGFWAASQVIPDWKEVIKVVDEVSLKDYNWGTYDPYNAGGIKDAVAKLKKPLWIHCYMQQGHDLNQNFIAAVEADNRVTGLMLYEVVYRPGNVKDGMIEITPDSTIQVVPGSRFQEMLVNPPRSYKVK